MKPFSQLEASPPVFQNGSWLYSRPSFNSVPPPSEKIIIMPWPDEYYQEDGKWKTSRRGLVIETPPDCDQEWFIEVVLFYFGYNYCGWMNNE